MTQVESRPRDARRTQGSSEPLITVITPAFGVEPYLEAAMRSVLSQSHRRLEYVVVDDGSPDGTLDVARRVAATDERVTVLSIAHAGSSAARNAGLQLARGEFVAFLDGDDVWAPRFLETMVDHLLTAPAGVVAAFCRSQLFDERGDLHVHDFDPGPYSLRRLLALWNPAGNGSCLLLRRSALLRAGPFDETLPSAVDLDMWLRMLETSAGHRFRGVSEVMVRYRRHAASMSADRSARFDGLFAIASRFGRRLGAYERRCLSYPILMGLDQGRVAQARRLYLAALPLAPLFALVDPGWRRATRRLLRAALVPHHPGSDCRC